MKTAVIYTGKYGTTESYAAYIADGLDADLFALEEAPNLNDYEQLVFGTNIYMGKLSLADFLLENKPVIEQKDAVLFTVSATKPDSDAYLKSIHDALPIHYLSHFRLYSLPGKIDLAKLSFLDKMVLKFMAVASKKPKQKEALTNGFDNTDFNQADKLIYTEIQLTSA